MTCIVGLETEHGVWLGADSFSGNEGWRSVLDPGAKLFEVPHVPLAVGIAGSWCLRQVFLQTRLLDIVEDDEITLFGFAEAWRARAQALGFNSAEDGATMTPNRGAAAALLAYRGRLWRLSGDWSLLKSPRYDSVGAGGKYADGAMCATRTLLPAEDRVLAALGAAAEHCPTVSKPFGTLFQAKP